VTSGRLRGVYRCWCVLNTVTVLSLRLEEILDECLKRTKEVFPKALAFMSGLLGEVSAEKIEKYVKPFLESIPHVAIHEAAHAYAEKFLEGIDLPVEKKIVLAEILARFIERKTSTWLREQGYSWVLIETFEEQVRELEAYSELREVKIPIEKYAELYWKFEESLERGELGKYVDTLARELGL